MITNAHPLVEITLMEQDGRKLVHLINVSGHSQTGYFTPVPMRDITLEVAGDFQTRLCRAQRKAPGNPEAGRVFPGFVSKSPPITNWLSWSRSLPGR